MARASAADCRPLSGARHSASTLRPWLRGVLCIMRAIPGRDRTPGGWHGVPGSAHLRRRPAGAGRLGGPARPDRHAHAAHPDHRARHPADVRRPWTPSPRRAWPSPWRRPAASASSTEPDSPSRPTRCARSRSSNPAWWSTRHHPSRADAGRRAGLMERAPDLRHSRGRARQRQAGRHPHQPRRALRHRPSAAGRAS